MPFCFSPFEKGGSRLIFRKVPTILLVFQKKIPLNLPFSKGEAIETNF